MQRKWICLLLAAALLLPLAACGGEPEAPADTTAALDEVSETLLSETEPAAPLYPDAVPELDCNGAAFRVLQHTVNTRFFTDDQHGEKLNDAVFERNRTIEERFRITIPEPRTVSSAEDLSEMLVTLVHSGEDAYELVFQNMRTAREDVVAGLLGNWYSLPYMDLTQAWYDDAIQEATINNKLLLLGGDLSLPYLGNLWMVAFNKAKAEDWNLEEDLYQTVRDGKWTLDYLMTLAENVYQDADGNGEKNKADFFGFVALSGDGSLITAFLYGCEQTQLTITADYEVEHTLLSERSIDLLNKLTKLFNTNPGSYYGKAIDRFSEGHALFATLRVNQLMNEKIVDMTNDFGVLPVPKYDEGQKEYHTIPQYGCSIMEFPKTVANRAMLGAIVEAMSALSWRDVTPIYCESVIELRSTRDAESAEMLRLILSTSMMDFNYLYAGTAGWVDRMRNVIQYPGTAVSYITERLDPIADTYYKVIDVLLEPEE